MRRVFASLLLHVALVSLCTASEVPPGLQYQALSTDARLAATEEDFTKAVDLYKKALDICPYDGALWMRLGLAQLKTKEFDAAADSFQAASKYGAFEAKFPSVCAFNTACAYSLKGDKDRAFQWLQTSLDLGFRFIQNLRTDEDLVPLHGDPRWERLAATADTKKMSRDEGWRYDLWFLDRETRRIHFDPYRVTSKNALDKFVADLHGEIPNLSDAQIRLRFLKYMRMLGDGHTRLIFSSHLPGPDGHASQPLRLPMQLYAFEEGLFVTAASPEYKQIVGAQILAIEETPVSQIWKLLETVVAQDNPQGLKSVGPLYLNYGDFLKAAGVARQADQVTFRVKSPDGKEQAVQVNTLPGGLVMPEAVTARKASKNPTPLYMKSPEKAYWFEFLPESKTLYFQYNGVRNDGDEPLDRFAKRMFEFIESNDVERFVVDARFNGGGNSFLNKPLVHGIIKSEKINQRGKLFVIIGRQTFSAAQNFVTDIGRECNAMFVGEPSGSSPNFVGETIQITLPYSGMQGSVSDLYWQRSWPMDHRLWIVPDLPAPPTFALYKDNRDPALEAILAYRQ